MPFLKRNESDAMRYLASGAITAGTVVAIGSVCGVATRDIAANTTGTISLEGTTLVPKPTGAGTDYARGSKVSLFGGQAVTGATGVALGYVDEQPATTDATVAVILWPGA
jgi:predicted RecA/RadA family phage recombinase